VNDAARVARVKFPSRRLETCADKIYYFSELGISVVSNSIISVSSSASSDSPSNLSHKNPIVPAVKEARRIAIFEAFTGFENQIIRAQNRIGKDQRNNDVNDQQNSARFFRVEKVFECF